MTQTLIEKLQELQRYEVDYIERGGEIYPDTFPNKDGNCVRYSDLRAIIEQYKTEGAEKQDIETHNGYIEGTAERLRLICSKLGIAAPVSNEEIMLCQFSLLGAIRRKIDAIYTAQQPDIIAELVKALDRLEKWAHLWTDESNGMLVETRILIEKAQAVKHE